MSLDMEAFSLQGKNIIITGASSGIGRACAIHCARFGANLVLVGRDRGRLEETKGKLSSGKHLIFAKDVTLYDNIKDIVAESVSSLGPLHGFIHSAGISYHKPLHLMTPKDFERTYAVNVIAAFEFARQIAARGNHYADGSSFVFIASVMASVGVALKVGYCSSKGALVSGMKAIALELAKKNIRVNTVSPGIIATELVDKNYRKAPGDALDSVLKNQALGMGMPENVAHSCIFLLSSAGNFITGTDLTVDGGYTAQ